MSEAYDLEAVYDAEIAPLMDKIIEVCKREGMPMLASFAYRHDESGDGTDCCTTYLPVPNRANAEYDCALEMIKKGIVAFAVTQKRL